MSYQSPHQAYGPMQPGYQTHPPPPPPVAGYPAPSYAGQYQQPPPPAQQIVVQPVIVQQPEPTETTRITETRSTSCATDCCCGLCAGLTCCLMFDSCFGYDEIDDDVDVTIIEYDSD